MKPVRLLWWHTALLAALLLFGAFAPGRVHAQFSEVVSVQNVTADQPTNFFVSWQSQRAVDGYYIRAPRHWALREVHISETMGGAPLDTKLQQRETDRGSVYRVVVESPLSGRYQNILQMHVGEDLGRFTWEMTPFVALEETDSLLTESRYEQTVQVERAPLFEEQYAVTFDPRVAGRPGLRRESESLSLSPQDSFTAEFWLKTVHLNQVVLSTWDGVERSAYPMEIMIGPRGYVNFYRGIGGMHHSLTSSRPLADGKWHHVAVTHDNSESWTRLMVDGQTVDSLHIDRDGAADRAIPVIIGGRPAAAYARQEIDPRTFNYTGTMDELRIWSRPRRERAVRSNIHRQIEGGREDLLRVGFDESDVEQRLTGETSGLQFVLSELSLFDPIEKLRAERQSNGVEVAWEAVPSYSEAFVVERSTDGQYFEEVSRVPAGGAQEEGPRRSRQYSVTDPTVHEGVVFYRVRQIVTDEERQPMAKTIKVGLRSPRSNTADLVGNFPNPFNAETLIKYELYEAQHVQLEVWDLSGHRRASLVNETQDPGEYDVRFDAANLPSGAYVIRLETERATRTHTMILMK